MAWKIISSLSNTQLIFWANLKAFVQFIFDTEVLAVAASAKGQAYAKIKEVSFKNSSFFLRREHKFCVDVKMYFMLYFPFSYCFEFFISEKTGLRVLKDLRIRLKINKDIVSSCGTENEKYCIFDFCTVQYLLRAVKLFSFILFLHKN